MTAQPPAVYGCFQAGGICKSGVKEVHCTFCKPRTWKGCVLYMQYKRFGSLQSRFGKEEFCAKLEEDAVSFSLLLVCVLSLPLLPPLLFFSSSLIISLFLFFYFFFIFFYSALIDTWISQSLLTPNYSVSQPLQCPRISPAKMLILVQDVWDRERFCIRQALRCGDSRESIEFRLKPTFGLNMGNSKSFKMKDSLSNPVPFFYKYSYILNSPFLYNNNVRFW